jgi:excisionase family DNA binding protein
VHVSESSYLDVGIESLGLLKVPQVAEYLGVSERTVRRLISSGQLKSVKVGRAVRIVPEDLAAYVESLRQGTATCPLCGHPGRAPAGPGG